MCIWKNGQCRNEKSIVLCSMFEKVVMQTVNIEKHKKWQQISKKGTLLEIMQLKAIRSSWTLLNQQFHDQKSVCCVLA